MPAQPFRLAKPFPRSHTLQTNNLPDNAPTKSGHLGSSFHRKSFPNITSVFSDSMKTSLFSYPPFLNSSPRQCELYNIYVVIRHNGFQYKNRVRNINGLPNLKRRKALEKVDGDD